TPARGDDVEPTIAVQIAGRDAVPTTHDAVQPPCGARVAQATVVVQEQLERSPLRREDQVGPAIAVHVGEDRRGYQTNALEQTGVDIVQHESAALVAEQPRRGRLRIRAGQDAPAHEQIHVAVPVHVGPGQGADAGNVPRHDRRDRV